MFYNAHFANKSREEIKKKMQEERFSPQLITDPPGYCYETHEHSENKYLVCLEGSMKVTFNSKTYNFEPGDKIIIQGDTQHSAVVGKDGCVFFWAEKII